MPLPKTDNARIQWTLNCEAEFPTVSADLGFSAAEEAIVLNDCGTMRFAIRNGQNGMAHSKAANSFKYELLGDSRDGSNEPEVPVFRQIPPPATIAGRGILKRLSRWEERVRAHPNFNSATGDLLQINSAADRGVDPDAAKPAGEGTALAGSVVRIDWRKGKFDGVEIEGQRGDENDWAKLERDFRSPFADERPPLVAGRPEERRYRMRYLLDDAPVGDWSDVIVVITKP